MSHYARVIEEAAGHMQKGFDILNRGPLSFYLRELAAAYALLMDRFAPLKVGDRCALKETLDLDKDSGWYPHRHFLIAGSKGTVVEADCGSNGFIFDVHFDNETWIDRDGKEHPRDKAHSFRLSENNLVKLAKP